MATGGFKYDENSIQNAKNLTNVLKSSFSSCGNDIKNIVNHFDKPSDMPSIDAEENAIRNLIDKFDDRIYEIISSINSIIASVGGTTNSINSGLTSLKDNVNNSNDFSFYGDFQVNQIPTRNDYLLNMSNPINKLKMENDNNPGSINVANYLIASALYGGFKDSEKILANQTLGYRANNNVNNNSLGMKKLTTFTVNTGANDLMVSSLLTNAAATDVDLGNIIINNTYNGLKNNLIDGNNAGAVNYTNYWIDKAANDQDADDKLLALTILTIGSKAINGDNTSINSIADYTINDAKSNKKKRDQITEAAVNAIGDKNANGDSYVGTKAMEFTILEASLDNLLQNTLLNKTCDEFGNNKLRSGLDELAFGYLSFVATTDGKVAASFNEAQRKYFSKQGFTDNDIDRIMSGKITISDLLEEIKNDPVRQSKIDTAQLMNIFVDDASDERTAEQNKALIESLENDEKFRKLFIDKYLNDYANNNLPNNNYSELALFYIQLKSQNDESLSALFDDASIKSLMHSCGIGYIDAQRVYKNEISLNDLFKEIDADQNSDRRKNLYETGYLANCGIAGVFSMADLNNLGLTTNKQITQLQQENYDELGRRELAASLILKKMSGGMSLNDALSKTTVAWRYVDSLGRVQITFDDPHADRAGEGVRKGYKYEALTYGEVFGDNNIFADLKKYDGKGHNEIINASKLFETSSFEIWRNADKNKLANNNSRIDELTRKLNNINTTYQTISENVKFDMSYIDPYLHSKDKKAGNFDTNVLNNVKKQMSASSSKGERGNNVIDVNSKEGLVNLITCAANGKVNFDGNIVSINGENIRYQSNDLILSRYGKYIDYMTDDEIAALNYTLKTGGASKAYDYLDFLSNILDRRWASAMENKYTQKGYDNWLLSTGEGLVLKSADGINSMVNTAHALMTGQDIKKADVLDRNSLLKSGAHNYIQDTYGEKAAFAYDIGSSMAESAVSTLLARCGGGGRLIETLATTINFAPGAYNSAVNDAVDRGLSTNAAVAYAYLLAASEVVTETIALDNFLSIGKKVITSNFNKAVASGTALLNQANVEGAEEVVNSLAGALFDDLIAGNQSEYNLNIKNYINKGYNEKDATALARKDFANEVKDAGVQGWVSGLCFGAFGTTSNAVKTNFIASEIDSALNTPSDQLTWKQKMAINQFNEYVDTVVNSISDASNRSIDEVRETLKQKMQTPLIQKTSKEVSPVNTQNKVPLKEKIGSWFSGLSKNTDVNNNQTNDVSTNTKDDIVETPQNTTVKSEYNDTKYSDYTLDQIMSKTEEYEEICSMFFELAKDDDTREKLKGILYDGGYNGFSLFSRITNKDNPRIDAQRRINFAYLLIRNPQTFDFFMKNQINLFHGTNGNALPTILKYGLNSVDESQKLGIDISTGESWSRIGGKRNFVSFTDMLDIAEGYSTFKSKTGREELNFEVLICTTKEDVKESGKVTIHSDVPEVGVDNKLPLDRIKAICVPSDKVEYVKNMVGGTIEVLPIDDIESKFYYIDNGGYVLDLNYDKYEKLKDIIPEEPFGTEKKNDLLANYEPGDSINDYIEEQEFDGDIVKQLMNEFTLEELVSLIIDEINDERTYNNLQYVDENTLSLIAHSLEKRLEISDMNMNYRTRRLFDNLFPGVQKQVFQNRQIMVQDILNNDLLRGYFTFFEKNTELFAKKSYDEYLQDMYDYIINKMNHLTNNMDEEFFVNKLAKYMEISDLMEKLINDNRIMTLISKHGGKEFFEYLYRFPSFYESIDKNSDLFNEYINAVLNKSWVLTSHNFADVINTYRNEPNAYFLDYALYRYVKKSTILDRFRSNKENFTQEDIQELINYMSAYQILENSKNPQKMNDKDALEAFNFINKTLLENNKAVDLAHYQSHVYNFAKYYSKSKGLNIEVEIRYEDSNFGGASYGGKVWFNTKFFDKKYKTDNHFLDSLETIFHEVHHEVQDQELKSLKPNKYNITQSIEKILRNILGEEYYESNYWTISYEIDARYNSFIELRNYVQGIAPKVYKNYEEYIDQAIRTENKMYELNVNTSYYENLYLTRDIILDRLIEKNPEIISNNPLLKYVYNPDGTRKTILELEEVKKDISDVEMIDYWLKTSTYSLRGIINELYSMENSEFNNINLKFFETLMLESNYYKDENFEVRIKEACADLKNIHPKNIDTIIDLENIILEHYKKLKVQFEERVEGSFALLNNQQLVNIVEANIDDAELIKRIIINCDDNFYVELINNKKISKEKIAPYLVLNKKYFKGLIDLNFTSSFDFITENILSHLDINELHNYISKKQIKSLSKELKIKFEEKFPGVINKIMKS